MADSDKSDDTIFFDLICVIDGAPATIRARRDEYVAPVISEEKTADV